MKIVIDTNILISSLLKNGKKFRDIIYNPENEVFAPNFLIVEIFKHKAKIVKYSGMTEEELLNELHLILKNISFINDKYIPSSIKQTAYDLCKDIDVKDTVFISLTFYLGATLLTGDKILKRELNNKNINIFMDF